MEVERVGRWEVVGIVAGVVLVLALLFLPWFTLTDTPQRAEQQAWICGEDEFSCTGFSVFPILRWLLIACAVAPAILAWILMRRHKLSWAPGEMTMVVGFIATSLIAYNGIIARPVPESGIEFGTGLEIGYWVALLASVVIGVSGYMRSLESGGRQGRKAPGTV